MLDMAFQILAFFILIYHPASSERAVPLHTSESTGKASKEKATTKPVIGIEIATDSSPGHAVAYHLRTDNWNYAALCDLQMLRDQLDSCQAGTAVRIIAQAGVPMSDVVAAVDAAAAAGLTAITFGEPAGSSAVSSPEVSRSAPVSSQELAPSSPSPHFGRRGQGEGGDLPSGNGATAVRR
jgi:biopolymer transport protein ExbD